VRGAVLLPVKGFGAAKRRLSDVLTADRRAELARRMAERVVLAAGSLPVFVVCDDDEVASWAEHLDAQVLWRPGHGLNGAVTDGVAAMAKLGLTDVVVAHADLPLAQGLPRAMRPGLITIVPDRRDDGTNVIGLPTSIGFRFGYGAASFRRHVAEARRHGVGVRVWRDRDLGLDVDLPEDLAMPAVQEVLDWLPTSPGSRR
jgi:2-phospho-L-lactate guanylyltransferase